MRAPSVNLCWYVSTPSPHGTVSLYPTEEELPEAKADIFAWVAKKLGVTEAQYRRALEREFFPQCPATTRKGSRCKNGAVNRPVEAEEFARLDGQYCSHHEGMR